MTRRFLFVLAASLPLLAQPDPARLAKQADAYAAQGNFQGTVLVAVDGKPILDKAYGLANAEWNIPNTPATRFRLGSITKQFTAMAFLLLEEQNKLKTTDPVCQFVSPCPDAWKPITIHHLLTHSAGIPNFTAFPDYGKTKALASPPAETIKRFLDKPLDFEPGKQMRYSNSGYVLLGYILEKVTGGTYEDYVRQNILKPLAMEDTGYDWGATVLPRRAAGYDAGAKELRNSDLIHMSIPHAAGSLYSTTHDLMKWDAALRAGKLISAASYKKYYTPVFSNYAYGWNVVTRDGVETISHGGGIDGFSTMIIRVPAEKLVVVTLSNAVPNKGGALANDLVKLALGKPADIPVKRTEIQLPLETLKKYVGEFPLAPTFILTVTLEGSQLFTQATGQPKIPVYASSPTEFFLKVVDAQIIFEADGSGLTLVQNGRRMPAKRKQ